MLRSLATLAVLITLALGANADYRYADRSGYPNDEILASPNFYDDIDAAAAAGENVHYLDLGMRRPKLTQVPAAVYELQNLKFLSLAFNRVAAVGPDISQLKALEELYLQGNHYLKSVSDNIGALENLRLVHIADTGLADSDIDKLRAILPRGCKLITSH